MLLLFCASTVDANSSPKKYETQFIVHSHLQTPADLQSKVADVIAKLERLASEIKLQNIKMRDLTEYCLIGGIIGQAIVRMANASDRLRRLCQPAWPSQKKFVKR